MVRQTDRQIDRYRDRELGRDGRGARETMENYIPVDSERERDRSSYMGPAVR